MIHACRILFYDWARHHLALASSVGFGSFKVTSSFSSFPFFSLSSVSTWTWSLTLFDIWEGQLRAVVGRENKNCCGISGQKMTRVHTLGIEGVEQHSSSQSQLTLEQPPVPNPHWLANFHGEGVSQRKGAVHQRSTSKRDVSNKHYETRTLRQWGSPSRKC